jgi:cob(I)alamin adenosyltransferase
MKIYTKTGDKGFTSLYDGSRTKKNEIFFEVLGELDELTSRIGMICALMKEKSPTRDKIYNFLRKIQGKIQDINTIIATIKNKKNMPNITEEDVIEIESFIDELDNNLPKLTKFILPGVVELDAQCHLCRTQTRKVERFLWKLETSMNEITIKRAGVQQILDLSTISISNSNIPEYINRLSDFFFTLARWFCIDEGKTEYFQ